MMGSKRSELLHAEHLCVVSLKECQLPERALITAVAAAAADAASSLAIANQRRSTRVAVTTHSTIGMPRATTTPAIMVC